MAGGAGAGCGVSGVASGGVVGSRNTTSRLLHISPVVSGVAVMALYFAGLPCPNQAGLSPTGLF